MTTLTEGNIRIVFPRAAKVRKFDDGASHGLTDCMKAVDFIVEEADRVSFIEFKDPDHPRATREDRMEFIDEFESGRLDEELKYKYRDSFLYRWASSGVDKPIHYWVLVAIDGLTDTDLDTHEGNLKRKLPLNGPRSGKWRRQIVEDCMVCNIRTWNRRLPRFPVSRTP